MRGVVAQEKRSNASRAAADPATVDASAPNSAAAGSASLERSSTSNVTLAGARAKRPAFLAIPGRTGRRRDSPHPRRNGRQPFRRGGIAGASCTAQTSYPHSSSSDCSRSPRLDRAGAVGGTPRYAGAPDSAATARRTADAGPRRTIRRLPRSRSSRSRAATAAQKNAARRGERRSRDSAADRRRAPARRHLATPPCADPHGRRDADRARTDRRTGSPPCLARFAGTAERPLTGVYGASVRRPLETSARRDRRPERRGR